MTVIRFEGVRKSFGEALVTHGLDLVIEDREFFTFVGGSGCGKSTILNMIAGLERPTDGRIYFDGEDVTDIDPGDRDVAMVFQSYALYPHMNVYENIAFPLRVRKTPQDEIDREVRKAAEGLGLAGLLNRRPGELSGGQRQRVALGRAIVRKPRVFLMDEPLSNLDARLRVEMRAELKRIHEELGITTVYVTHDQEEAMSLSDRIAALADGVIQQVGRPESLYHDPANLFVAGFIGSPPMNFIDAASLRGTFLEKAIEQLSGGGEMVAGIRPQDIEATAEEYDEALAVDVMMLEPTGRDVWADGAWKGVKLKGRAAPGENIRPKGRAYFRIPPDKTFVFNKRDGRRIL